MRSWKTAANWSVFVAEQTVRVECYSGYKADERPMRLHLGARVLDIAEVEDRWYSPGETYFRVLTSDGDRYVLCHIEAQDIWTITAYRAAEPSPR